MQPIRVGLMGLGRVGRGVFRLTADRDDIHLVAIAEKIDPAALAYLLRFDSPRGRFGQPVTASDGAVEVAGRKIAVVSTRDPEAVDWQALGVDVVIEEGAPRNRATLEGPLARGARRVVLCSPPSEAPDLTVLRGINDDQLTASHRIVSAGSFSAAAAAPILATLEAKFGLERVFLSSVHAYTDDQRLADVPAPDMRSGRAAAENIVPQPSYAGPVLESVMPGLAGKLDGQAMNVPVANGSAVDLVCWHRDEVSVETIQAAVREAADSARFAGILAYEPEPIVSSDVIGSSHSATFDAQATMALGGKVSKTLTWFDNGWGRAHRVLELIERFRRLEVA